MEKDLIYITSNIAPFRVDLLDELSQYFKKVTLCYYEELEEGVNPLYVKKRPQNVELQCLKDLSILDSFKIIEKASFIIFDGYSGKSKILLMFACILKKKKYMISIDGIIPKRHKDGFLRHLLKHLLIGKAAVVFSTNHRSDEIIRGINFSAKIVRHIFSTIKAHDIDGIKSEICEELALKYDINMKKKKIVFVGKFLIAKGIKELLECAKEMEYEFILIGGTKQQLEENNLKIVNNVKIIPFLEKKDVLSMMSISDVFVLPTYTDVWGLVIIEALMCGTPVVTTNQCNAGIEFITEGKNGYIVPIRDSESLSKAIEKALALNKENVQRYNVKALGNYTIENSAYNMQKIIYEKG